MSIPNFTPSDFVEPFSAGTAVACVFRGLQKKSAIQTGSQMPAFTIKSCTQAGGIVGAQVFAEAQTKKIVQEYFGTSVSPETQSAISAALVGGVSTGPLIVLNGISLGQTPQAALWDINRYKVATMACREVPFLASVSASQPLTQRATDQWGDTPVVRTLSQLTVAGIGSVASQPADTYLSRQQSGKPICFKTEGVVRPLMRGTGTRAACVGTFNVLYNNFKEAGRELPID